MSRANVFFVLCAVGGLLTAIVGDIAKWSDGTTYTVGIVAMAVLMLIAFPLIDPDNTGSPLSRR